ncbi:MAG: type II secretion system F family protein [Candidatus Hydrogenedentota bacterium]|nr:MAG: type II secretion system F family protein [Candidatus Hydrogenedentota bacterium]
MKSMANFSKQAAVSIQAGLTLSRAFPLIARESRDRRLRSTLRRLNHDLTGGGTLAEALRRQGNRFPPIFVEMVAAGERSGHLDAVFARLADYFDTRLKLRRATVRASIYPLIQLTMAYAVVCLIAILFSSNKAATGQTIVYYTIVALISLVVTYFFFSRTSIGRAIWDRFLLSVPLLRSVPIKLCMARFTRTLAMQLESAIPMTEAIERSALVTGNGAVAKSLGRMAEPIRHGASLAEAVGRSRFLTPMIREVLAVGEETGNFTESLERIANIYEEESMVVLESIPKLIGPVVAVIVGIVVVYLFYTVYVVHYLKPLLEQVGM